MTNVTDALRALAEGDWTTAATTASLVAAEQPEGRLAVALAEYFEALPAPGVYDEPSAFEAFIDNGNNPELYRRTIEQLRQIHAQRSPRSVMEVGCGDGRVTASVVSSSTRQLDLVEPSEQLLASAGAAVEAVADGQLRIDPHATDIAAHLESLDDSIRWDIVQSTFAMHTTTPSDRPAILADLARRTPLLLIVEFDVPDFADGSAAHVEYLADRYEQGVREYHDHPEVVSGFLMPVLVGQLDPTRPRFTFEQPIAAWEASLRDAGFATTTTPVVDYWWADATLIAATSTLAG
ncbi:class I SAM-dependent methyltransferase [soil metagenome]